MKGEERKKKVGSRGIENDKEKESSSQPLFPFLSFSYEFCRAAVNVSSNVFMIAAALKNS